MNFSKKVRSPVKTKFTKRITETFVLTVKTKMDFSSFGDKYNKSNLCFPTQFNIDEYSKWKMMCATDCNGNFQNLSNPGKTRRCYFNNNGVHRYAEDKNFVSGQLENKCFVNNRFPEDKYFSNNRSTENKLFSSKYYPDDTFLWNNRYPEDKLLWNDRYSEDKFLWNNSCPDDKFLSNKMQSQDNFLWNKEGFKKSNLAQDLAFSKGLFVQNILQDETKLPSPQKIDSEQRINSDKLSSLLEKTNNNAGLMQGSFNKGGNKNCDNSELSFFSDKPIYNNDFSSLRLKGNDIDDYKDNRFKLFPEKSSSSPSIMDGLSSYFTKNNEPRPRCFSDSKFKSQTPSSEDMKQDIKSSDLHSSRARLTSLPKLEVDVLEKETRNENEHLKNVFSNENDKQFKSYFSVECDNTLNYDLGTYNQISDTDSVFSPSPERSTTHNAFDFSSEASNVQDIMPIENMLKLRNNSKTETRQSDFKEPYNFNKGPTFVNSVMENQIVPFGQSNDIYSFHFKMQNDLLSYINCPVYCSIEAGRITYNWTNVLNRFQSLAITKKDENERITPVGEQSKKTNYKKNSQQDMECKFCKSNLETQKTYKSHNLKQRVGKRTLVTCPVLRKLTCERCGETGDNAHTLSYCPLVIAESGRKPLSVAAALKKTKRVASGRIRKTF